jgi:hypothetical protein
MSDEDTKDLAKGVEIVSSQPQKKPSPIHPSGRAISFI